MEKYENLMEKIFNAFPLDETLYSEYPKSRNLAEKIYKEFSLQYQGKKKNDLVKLIQRIITNFHITCYQSNKLLSYSRDKNEYTKLKNNLEKTLYTYKETIMIFDLLEKHNYCQRIHGSKYKKYRSCIFLTGKLINEFQNWNSELFNDTIKFESQFPVIVRDAEGDRIDPLALSQKDKQIYSQKFCFVKKYNDFLGKFQIKNKNKISSKIYNEILKNPNLTEKILFDFRYQLQKFFTPYIYCIFNRSSCQFGGRFYSKFQKLSKEKRLKITINNEPVIELDYSAFRLRMLYHLERMDLRKSLYMNPYYDKEITKKGLMVIINSKNKESALKSFTNSKWHKSGKHKGERFGLFRDQEQNIKASLKKANNFIETINTLHPRIKKYFYSDKEIELQKFDSDLAMEILEKLIEKNILAIPIHDSFIVAWQNEGVLEKCMKEIYFKIFNFYPKLK